MNKTLLSIVIWGVLGQVAFAQSVDTVWLTDALPMTFVSIPAGSFSMGSEQNAPHAQKDEYPVHDVTLTKSYAIGQYEVTQAQWAHIMGYNPSAFRHPERPADMISWNDTQVFIKRLNELGLGTFRLPTEAEWERACQLGGYDFLNEEKRILPWKLRQYAWFHSHSEGRSHPVGLKTPGAFQLYDMIGNLWEWCSDWYGPYEEGPQVDPQGPESGNAKVYRGDSWFNEPAALRPVNRHRHPVNERFTNAGLRLVLEQN
ncbi:MAG: formylglycine-generating enzyme family protein [Mameliella sp.]|nr:formylglycine-generating enzyme family protein [Phaeodactylibacter sp.]